MRPALLLATALLFAAGTAQAQAHHHGACHRRTVDAPTVRCRRRSRRHAPRRNDRLRRAIPHQRRRGGRHRRSSRAALATRAWRRRRCLKAARRRWTSPSSVSATMLDEVVVTGTAGGELRRSIGNAVATIDAADMLAKSAATNLTSLLNARAPGLNVLPTTGRLGAGPSIQIRGRSSIGLSNTPLVYVDGVRVNSASGTGPAARVGRSRRSGLAGRRSSQRHQPRRHREHRGHQRVRPRRRSTEPKRRAASSRSSRSAVAPARSRRCRSAWKPARCISATPRTALPTNYAKDRTGNDRDLERREAGGRQRPPAVPHRADAPLHRHRRPADATCDALLRVGRVRERLRHRAEQLDASVLDAREPQHVVRPDDGDVDEPQLRA